MILSVRILTSNENFLWNSLNQDFFSWASCWKYLKFLKLTVKIVGLDWVTHRWPIFRFPFQRLFPLTESINSEWLVPRLSNLIRQILVLIAFTLKLNKLGRCSCFVRIRVVHVPFIATWQLLFSDVRVPGLINSINHPASSAGCNYLQPL